jgi:hypothetical protein
MLARLALLATLLGLVRPAHAEIMDTTGSLSSGHLGLGVELQAGLDDGLPLAIHLHEDLGLAGGVDLTVDQTIPLEGGGVLLAIGGKWTLVHRGRSGAGFALWVQGFYDTGSEALGPQSYLMLDFQAGRFTPYFAADARLTFLEGDGHFSFGVIGGSRIALGSSVGGFIEVGIGIEGSGNVASGGLRFSL